MSLNTRQMGATLLAALKMKITTRGINHSLPHCMDDSVPTAQQRKGKSKWENPYIHSVWCVHTRLLGPQLGNLNSSKVSAPPVPQCLAVGLWLLPANRKRTSGSWLHPPMDTGRLGFSQIQRKAAVQHCARYQGSQQSVSSVRKCYLGSRKEESRSWNSGI